MRRSRASLRPGGEFRFVTDWPDYAAWTLRHLLQSPAFEWTAERAELIGAGLFVRTLINLQQVDTGFSQENVLLFQIDTDSAGFKEDSRLVKLYSDVEERVKAIPGVRAAAFSMFAFNQGGWVAPASTRSEGAAGQTSRSTRNNSVGPDFFNAMGLPLLEGRQFGPQDTETSPKVSVISEAMARQFFPGASALGKRFGQGGPEHSEDIEVIGVVKDAKYGDLMEEPKPMAYYPYTQSINYLSNFEVGFSGDPRAVVTEIRRAPKGSQQPASDRGCGDDVRTRKPLACSGKTGCEAFEFLRRARASARVHRAVRYYVLRGCATAQTRSEFGWRSARVVEMCCGWSCAKGLCWC